MRMLGIGIVLCLVMGLFATPAAAQEPRTFTTYDGYLSFTLPASWLINEEADASGSYFFAIASSEAALRGTEGNQANPPPAGDIAMLVFRWPYLERTLSMGAPNAGDTPEAVLNALLGGQSEALGITYETVTIGGYPATTFTAVDESNFGKGYALDMGVGGLLVVVASAATEADFALHEAELLFMLESLTFGAGSTVHYATFGFLPTRTTWSPDSSTYAVIAMFPLADVQPIFAGLYRADGTLIGDSSGMGVAWNADGSRAVLYGDRESSAAVIYDTVTGERLGALTTAAFGLTWSPSDRLIVSGDLRQATRVFDSETRRQLFSLPPSQSWAFNGDESRLVTWNYDATSLTLWDMSSTTPSGTAVWTVERKPMAFASRLGIPEVSWSPDFSTLLIIDPDGVPTLIDAASGSPVASFPPPDGLVVDGLFWHENDLVIDYQKDGCRVDDCAVEIVVIDGATREVRLRLPHPQSVGPLVWSPDGAWIASATDFDGLSVAVWDAVDGAQQWMTPLEGAPTRVQLHWLGDERLLVESALPNAPLLDAQTGEVIALNAQEDEVSDFAISPDGSEVLMSGGAIVRVRSAVDGTQISALPHDGEVTSVQWSADGSLIYTTSEGAALNVWDAEAGYRLVQIVERTNVTEPDYTLSAILSPDESFVILRGVSAVYERVWPLAEQVVAAQAANVGEVDTLPALDEAFLAAYNEGDFQQAIDIGRRYLRIDPDSGDMRSKVGIAHYQLGELDAAIAELELAVALDPDEGRVYFRLGDVLRDIDEYADAREVYEAALAVTANDNDRAQLYNRVGLTHFSESSYAEAAAAFTAATELVQTNPVFYRNLGYSFYRQGEAFYPDAINAFQIFVQLAGSDADEETVTLLAELTGE